MAVEAVPNLGWTKGTAITWLSKKIGKPVLPIYAGDHANDAEAIAATKALNGVAIGVGPNSPRSADHKLTNSAAFVVFLRRLSHFLTTQTA
jgi:trehalose-6-phosphatase